VGPEVVSQAQEVLDAVGDKFGHVFNYVELEAGGCAIDHYGVPLPEETLAAAKECGAVLLGAMGGPKWDKLPGDKRPEKGLLALRSGLGVYANLRPAKLFPQLREACPLKEDGGFDLLIVRELIGGIYFGERGRSGDGRSAFDTEKYSVPEIERILKAGYQAAMGRRKKLCVVDKANVLESSRLWREVAAKVSADYPEVETSFLYVDNAAMQLVRDPGQFDVIVTSNMFGDILSDEASVLTGSIGMLPSASIGGEAGVYEPIHGSAPDIAGQDIANPLATILSAAMLLRYSFGLEKEACAIETAVNQVLDAGLRTKDIVSKIPDANEKVVGTRAMGEALVKIISEAV
jgi:3-isopropylmalate dehydrogenase